MATKDIVEFDLSHAVTTENADVSEAAMEQALASIRKIDAKDVEAFIFTAKLKPSASTGGVPRGLHGLAGPIKTLVECMVMLEVEIERQLEKLDPED